MIKIFGFLLICLFFTAGISVVGEDEKPDETPCRVITIHYHRYEGDYPTVGIWTWDATGRKSPDEQEIFPEGKDDYGLVFKLNPEKYGGDYQEKKIGLLPRLNKNWDQKDGGDRFWTPDMGCDIWLVENSSRIYTEAPDVSPKVLFGYVDGKQNIMALLSHKIKSEVVKPENFKLVTEEGDDVAILAAKTIPANAHKTNEVRLVLKKAINLETGHTLSAKDYKPSHDQNVIPRKILSDPDLFYSPEAELGAIRKQGNTTFRVFAPTASKVFVVTYSRPEGDFDRNEYEMKKADKGIWEITVEKDLKGKYYVYRLKGPGLDPELEVIDPYARCVTDRDGRGLIVDLGATNPEGFDPMKKPPLKNQTDAVIYEVHVHEFTVDPASGADKKGLFLGFGETGTHLDKNPDVKTGMDHLKELGITHVQLMPIQDFDNDETIFHQSNWGYMPVHFNTPDGWFATERLDDSRVREFKQLVKDCHDNGIRVIMDVVYNHTAPPASFDKIVPNYYFRKKPDGSYWNGSGCGNEFKSENPMAGKFIIDSLKYWVQEYGVDGFRFDLMGLIDLETMTEATEALHEIDPTIMVYGEPWAAGDSGLSDLTSKGDQRGRGFGAFNDDARDAIKGSTTGTDGGFIQEGTRGHDVIEGIRSAIHTWAEEPLEAIIYCAAHDDMTLWDKILKSTPDTSEEKRRQMQKQAAAILMTAQGPVFIHSGQEMCRTKGGSENSYNASEKVNMIHWYWKIKFKDVFDYYRGMIALRKKHPAFRLSNRKEIEKRLRFDSDLPSPKSIAFTINSRGVPGEESNQIRVMHNGDVCPLEFYLPQGMWKVMVKDDQAGTETIEEVSRTVTVAPGTSMVCIR